MIYPVEAAEVSIAECAEYNVTEFPMSESRLSRALIELGHLLAKARQNSSYTQTQVAEAIGLSSPQFISNCERGQCKPSPKYQKFLIEYCRVSKAELINLLLKIEKIRLIDDINEAAVGSVKRK